ncbi:hypothetical protein ACFLZP_00895, partial [Patescibacteria group bacterium]
HAEIALEQTKLRSGDQGEDKELSPEEIQKKREEEQEKLSFFRRRLKEISQEIKQVRDQREYQAQQAQQQEEQEKLAQAQQAQQQSVPMPEGKSQRGSALRRGKGKKKKGSGEMGAFQKRSK